MRTVWMLTIRVLVLLIVGEASAGAASPSPISPSAASVAAAAKSPCWNGSTKLVASPANANPGELVTLRTIGSDARFLDAGGNITTFERPTSRGMAVAYYLISPGGTQTTFGIVPFAPNFVFGGVGLVGAANVRTPDVPPGNYQLVRFYNSEQKAASVGRGSFPKSGASLCASLHVLAAVPAVTATNDVGATASPSASLRNGERITVTLRGFGVGGKVWLSECAFVDELNQAGCGPALPEQAETFVSSNGAATTTFVVRDHASAAPNRRTPTFLCATNCVLVATLGIGFADVAVPLDFAQPGAAVGALDAVGGAAPGLPRRVPGIVTFRSTTGRTYSTATTSDGEFSLAIAPGSYAVTGKSPKIRANGADVICREPGAIAIAPGRATIVEVFCEVK